MATKKITPKYTPKQINAVLLGACMSALSLENSRRAGCELEDADYAIVYEVLTAAISIAREGK